MKKIIILALLIPMYFLLVGFNREDLFRELRIIKNPREVVFLLLECNVDCLIV